MTRRLGVVAVVVPVALSGVLVAGCASSGTARSPLQIVAGAAAKTSATNARVALTGSVSAAGQSLPIHGQGGFDFAQHRGTIQPDCRRGNGTGKPDHRRDDL